jgi:hypothetical protein
VGRSRSFILGFKGAEEMSARSPHDTRGPDSRSDYEQTFDNPVREGLPTIRELALLWFSLSRLADREQENGTLVLGMR